MPKPPGDPLEICILAGGLSQRMGRDKAQLRLGRKTMLGQIQATARATGWPVRVIRHDLVARCGPLGGVYTALQTTRTEAVLFLACDVPFVSVQLIGRLVREFQATPAALFIARNGRIGFPFLLPRRNLAAVARQLERGELSLQGLAMAVNGKRLVLPRALALQLRNVNTPGDWERARRLWSRRKKAAPAGKARTGGVRTGRAVSG